MPEAKIKIALISPEIYPLAQTGGLANMIGSLGPALQEVGCEVSFVLPKYRTITDDAFRLMDCRWDIRFPQRAVRFHIWKGPGPGGLPVYLIDIPEFFDRPQLYGEYAADYPDNAARFIAFCQATLQGLPQVGGPWDILHVHDWQTALIPLYLKTLWEGDPGYQDTRTVLTIHNQEYQGRFPPTDFPLTGLSPKYFSPRYLEFFGIMNFLKGGMVSADALTTVSPTYAREVMTREFGCGLEGVLRDRTDRFFGILNGIDEAEWDPSNNPDLPAHFSPEDLRGKLVCKTELQKELGLPVRAEAMVLGMVSRLVHQKGVDLVAEVIPKLMGQDLQWIFLGSGDPQVEDRLLKLKKRFPDHLALRIGFDPHLAHRITAGTDFFLMPSRFEPCGYNQLFSQRYGSLPIGRATGGLIDSIIDVSQNPERGTGFFFSKPTASNLLATLRRALEFARNPTEWEAIRRRAMKMDFSWRKSALAYVEIYRKILAAPRSPVPRGI